MAFRPGVQKGFEGRASVKPRSSRRASPQPKPPTLTEETRRQSLPADIRDLPPEEVEARQSLRAGETAQPARFTSGGGRATTTVEREEPVTVAPAPPAPPPPTTMQQTVAERARAQAGAITATERVRRQSLPADLRDRPAEEVEARQVRKPPEQPKRGFSLGILPSVSAAPGAGTGFGAGQVQAEPVSAGVATQPSGEVLQSFPTARIPSREEFEARQSLAPPGTLPGDERFIVSNIVRERGFQDPLLSVAGQKERLGNVAAVFGQIGGGTFDFGRGILAKTGVVTEPPRRFEGEVVINLPRARGLEPILQPFIPQSPIGVGVAALPVGRVIKGGAFSAKIGGGFATNLAKDIVTSVGGAGLVSRGIESVGAATAPREQRLAAAELGISDIVFREGFEAQRKQAREEGFVSGLVEGLNPFFGSREAFERATGERIRSVGGGAQAEAFFARQRTIKSIADAAALVFIGKKGEQIGRREIGERFSGTLEVFKRSQAGRRVAQKVFVPIARAGFIEGGVSVVSEAQTREATPDPKEIAIGAVIGAVSAGVLGSAIGGAAASRVRGVTKAGRVLEFGAFIVDPFEKPGDILEDISEGFGRRVLGRKVLRPTIQTGKVRGVDVGVFSVEVREPKPIKIPPITTFIKPETPTPTTAVPGFAPTVGEVTVIESRPEKSVPAREFVPTTLFPTTQRIPTIIPGIVPTGRRLSVPVIPTPTPVPIPVPPVPVIPTPTPTPTPVPVIPTPVPVPSTAFTPSTTIPIPAVTPVLRFPAPLIPGGGGGGFGGFGRGRRGGKAGFSPSLIALEFGIFGKTPRGRLTGLETRPIPLRFKPEGVRKGGVSFAEQGVDASRFIQIFSTGRKKKSVKVKSVKKKRPRPQKSKTKRKRKPTDGLEVSASNIFGGNNIKF